MDANIYAELATELIRQVAESGGFAMALIGILLGIFLGVCIGVFLTLRIIKALK